VPRDIGIFHPLVDLAFSVIQWGDPGEGQVASPWLARSERHTHNGRLTRCPAKSKITPVCASDISLPADLPGPGGILMAQRGGDRFGAELEVNAEGAQVAVPG